jgi:hypothetical protein
VRHDDPRQIAGMTCHTESCDFGAPGINREQTVRALAASWQFADRETASSREPAHQGDERAGRIRRFAAMVILAS